MFVVVVASSRAYELTLTPSWALYMVDARSVRDEEVYLAQYASNHC